MKTAIVLLLVGLLAGCSSTPGIKAQIAGANIEIAKTRAVAAAKPVLDAEIPTPNGVMRIVVHAPQGPNNGQVAMPDDAWARVAERAVGGLVTAAGIYLGGSAAIGLVNAAGTGIIGALQSQAAPVVVQPATPIVVTQPAPLVITQPAPLVVNPVVVDPVVVNPVVVEPVIVNQPPPIIVGK